ncbi:zinc finger CW-type PWWP domain protein 1-like isoform X2 [Mytilus californianus]|uniref:zinc finger CW-type PWWP domain protein 1-like isoform X2 n=1 Tax=Mytilus californianus TaxID=6549 RepID=UPI002247EF76|nr:zinc finger CW-type PWWP domain protein 1-like isoform X2 [Mytilus californianus]
MTDPKKPSFKRTFAVPKLKAGVKAEISLLSPKNLFKAAENNTAKSETVQVQPSSGKCDDSNDVIDKEQDKENNAVGLKKVKSKKSLFQAPCTSDIDKKEVKEELSEKNKKRGTKKSLKEQSNTDSDKPKPKKIKKMKSNADDNVDVSKPKKVKKDKESADKTENLSKPKKAKKKKSDSEAQNEAKAGEDTDVQHEQKSSFEKEDEDDEVKNGNEMVCTEENEESVFQPAIEMQQSKDDSDEIITEQEEKKNEEAHAEIQIKKSQASDATTKEPPRSLSDQEYEEIFQAVLDRCNNTSLEEMYESLNKPVKEKKQKEMKATSEKVTKPKQIKKTKTKKPKEQTQAQVVPTSKKFDKAPKISERNTDVKVQEEKQLGNDCNSDEEQQSEEELDVLEFENVDEVEECQALSQLIPDEVINGLQSLSNTVEPNFQDVNEETPEGSEVDYKLPVQKTPPPKKSKNSENHSSIKKQKLAPKQLNFPKKIEELKKENTKSETKSSKKKLKMDEQVSKKLTKEKEPDKLASKEKSRKKEMQERYLTREKLGTWVQCGDKNCSKWRYLPDCEDPSELPEVWTCNMNTDKRYNSCEADEQNYNEDEHIFTNFAEGSVVWAKMAGFPWWPSMIEIDPDTESYFMLMTAYTMYPSHYHVVFFDDKVSRAWVNATSIRKYTGGIEDDNMTPKPTKGGKGYASFSKDLVKAKTNALLAYDMSVSDRLKNFSFAKRYRGTYGKVYQSDSSQETPKPKNKPKIRKTKVEAIGNGMIDSALEEDDNEEAVLKGIEEVLDAIDDELDAMDEDCEDEDDEDFKMTEEIENKTNIRKHGDEKKKMSKVNSFRNQTDFKTEA